MLSTPTPSPDPFNFYDDVGLINNDECEISSQYITGTVAVQKRGRPVSVERVTLMAIGEIRSNDTSMLLQRDYSIVENSCSPTVCSLKAVPAEWKVEFEVNITKCEVYSTSLKKIIVSSNWPYPVYVSDHNYYLVRTTTVYFYVGSLDLRFVPFSRVRFPALCSFHQHYYLFDYFGCKFYRVCDINPSFIPHGLCRHVTRAS
nr:TPA_asm: hypothetical protein [Clonorsi virus 1]